MAASNAGGAWSVVGDTTTTMMWIAGIRPAQVFHAIIAATVALFIFGVPAAMVQQKYSPLMARSESLHRVDWARIYVVAVILLMAIATNVFVNNKFPRNGRPFSVHWRRRLGGNCGWRFRAASKLETFTPRVQRLSSCSRW